MFGFLVADTSLLKPEQLERYRSCYCGLCRELKKRHGQLSRLTLNYDMTFLVLLLSSLYEPQEQSGKEACIVHPFVQRFWCSNEITGYAADMNIALAYLKCIDNWHDDIDPVALAEAGVLKSGYDEVKQRYPRQCYAMEESIKHLNAIEKVGLPAPDDAAACFGTLMGEIFAYRDDRWSEDLRHMGDALGRFIYLMDACIDLDADRLLERYNPFRRYYGRTDNEQRFRDILKMIMGDCIFWYDRLPTVQDSEILRNVLCSGLWLQFNKKFRKGKESSNVSGSV